MKLEDILREKKPAILKRWLDAIMETYPPETAGLLKGKKNRFTDPVGYTIHDGMDGVIDGLIREAPFEEISPFLDSIIKIRAVQNFSASQAVAFIFDLKWIIGEELRNMSHARGVIDAATLSAFESKLDNLALISFDIYMESREKIYELKASETKNMVYRLVQRQNQLYETQGQGLYLEIPNLS
ncbi:MAG TPA: RsbRD N-terminal domain-containing protein [Anaerolineae bacterium]|nr:RsbRD N-terminal domain-containing protein [Anaerolineae bacterium]